MSLELSRLSVLVTGRLATLDHDPTPRLIGNPLLKRPPTKHAFSVALQNEAGAPLAAVGEVSYREEKPLEWGELEDTMLRNLVNTLVEAYQEAQRVDPEAHAPGLSERFIEASMIHFALRRLPLRAFEHLDEFTRTAVMSDLAQPFKFKGGPATVIQEAEVAPLVSGEPASVVTLAKRLGR